MIIAGILIGYLHWMNDSYWLLPWMSDSYWLLALVELWLLVTPKWDFLIWLMLQMITARKNTLVRGDWLWMYWELFRLATCPGCGFPIGHLSWMSDSYWLLALDEQSYWLLTRKSDFLIWLMLRMMTAGKNTLVSVDLLWMYWDSYWLLPL